MKKEELKELLKDMSLKEKVGQMLQIIGIFYMEDADSVLTGPWQSLGITVDDMKVVGSILGTHDADTLMKIQKMYMEDQPHHIPMLFMMDVIHGMKTIFPAPLGQGAAFDPELAERCAAAVFIVLLALGVTQFGRKEMR